MNEWTNLKYKLSISKRPVDKRSMAQLTRPALFETRDLTMRELVRSIRKGHAFCTAKLRDDCGQEDGFTTTQILSVEFNDGTTLDDVIITPIVQTYATMIFTTVGHTERKPRFCILFGLPRPTTRWWKTRAATDGLNLLLKHELTYSARSTIHAGNPQCKTKIFDQGLTWKALTRLNDEWGWEYNKRVDQTKDGLTGALAPLAQN